ncbi:hypothetical protein PUMCH_001210 [Australozyma saopauloensis]|uniref:Uncharacterized protein n=1 Tax=Australozyma saopauloensis TaxID=291208 RepID=A0AAX4H633_9ASCO|nr:hypothetical protein PUMCH_001210 [[Candida] saopauloensis]
MDLLSPGPAQLQQILALLHDTVEAALKFRRCQFPGSLLVPLYDPYANYVNPCFLSSVLLCAQLFFGAIVLYQLCNLLLNNRFGPYRIKYSFGLPWSVRSVGFAHFLRVNCASLQAVAFGVLTGLNLALGDRVRLVSLMALFLVASLVVLPLHFCETTRSPVGSGSLILYWFVSLILLLAITAVDFLSPYKVFVLLGHSSTDALAYTVELTLFLNAVVSYNLETHYYTPSVELKEYFDLCGWDISTVKNLVESLTFTYLNPVLQSAYEHSTIGADEVPPPIIELDGEVTITAFNKSWQKEMRRAAWWRDKRIRTKKDLTEKDKQLQPSLFFAILRVHYMVILKGLCYDIGEMSCLTLAPLLLQKFIVFFTEYGGDNKGVPSPPIIKGFALAVSIYLCSVVRYFSFNQYFLAFILTSTSIKSTLTNLIYDKAMKLSPESRREKGTGEIVNHVAADVNEIALSIETCSDALTIPLRLILSLVALYKILGNAMWAGLALAVVLVPLSSMITSAIYGLYNQQMKYKDERSKLTSEILNSIKSIKLYSWETPMLSKLDEVRNKKELRIMKKAGIYNAGSSFLWECIPFFVSCAVYSAYALFFNEALVPSVIFPALALFDLLAQPIQMLPYIFSNIAEAKVALERVGKFFVLEERATNIVQRSFKPSKKNDVNVEIKNATFVWSSKTLKDKTSPEESKIALKDINFQAKKGQLTCIVGRVGAGKTSILNAILGGIPLVENPQASIWSNGKIAYCPQNPCIFNTSIRENIIFGKKFDKSFYDQTVEACQLTSDFEVLPNGDATLVGEKGISLSGGQRARLSLARALYSRAEIYLLDDVLSAVDAHVGKKITQQVLGPKGLLASKTLVLATNSVKILKLALEIVYVQKGEIKERGSYTELMRNDGEVYRLVKEYAEENHDEVEEDTEEKDGAKTPASANDSAELVAYIPEDTNTVKLTRITSATTIGAASLVSFGHEYAFEADFESKADKEETNKGNVKWSVYLEFLKACNWIYIIVWLVFNFAVVEVAILGNWVLKYWSEKNLSQGDNVMPGFYLLLYLLTGVAGALLSFTSAYIIWSFCAIRSSSFFHDEMAKSVLRSPMSFFDTTPIGRILNRFSDDLSSLDQEVLWNIMLFASLVIECFSRLAIVIYNLPMMLFVILFLVFLYNYFRSRFMPAMRELKRLRSILRSPVFSHLQESINGVETLMAYDEIDRYSHSMKSKVSVVTKIDWTTQCCNRWLSMRLQSIAAIIVLTSSLMILISFQFSKQFSPAMVGFIMTYVFTSTTQLNAIVRMWTQCEVKAVNIERILEYHKLPSEAAAIIEDSRPSSSWPEDGTIHFKNYSTRYREGLDLILRNISLDIKPAEKIGIVGRTGAGKSSLTLALFRIIEPVQGNVEIDQINTSEIGLFDLRSQLNIIPQDAHAFEGSVRENLDPFKSYSDEQLWKVLEMAHLKEHVESMKSESKDDGKKDDQDKKDDDVKDAEPQVGLNARVTEGGSNLSSGQKQLLCLARALLKESKVLVLDEATAAVDVQTDKIIQATIRSEFKDKTILTIAHRLDTIMDSDRVLVLERGTIKEFDSPTNLLNNRDSEFYSLCKEGGYLDENGNLKTKNATPTPTPTPSN